MPAAQRRMLDVKQCGSAVAFDIHQTTLTRQAAMSTGSRLAAVRSQAPATRRKVVEPSLMALSPRIAGGRGATAHKHQSIAGRAFAPGGTEPASGHEAKGRSAGLTRYRW